MGKQNGKWNPPEDAVADQPAGKQVAWTPPEDAIAEPVKKKDDGVVGSQNQQSEDGSIVSEKPAAPSLKPTEEKSAFTKFARTLADIPEYALRTAAGTFADQIPAEFKTEDLRMAKGSMESMLDEGANIRDSGFESSVIGPSERDQFNKWNNSQPASVRFMPFDKKAKQFLKDKWGDEYHAKNAKFQEELSNYRVGLEKEIQAQNKEYAQKIGNAPQNVSDVTMENVGQFVGNLVGQAFGRIPASIASGGASSFIAERSAVFNEQLDQMSEKTGLPREEIIKRGMDNPETGRMVADFLALSDVASLGNILSGSGKKILKKVLNTGIEASQEVLQGEGEVAAGAAGAGTNYKPDVSRMVTAGLGGAMGAGAVGAVIPGENKVKTPAEVISESKATIASTSDIKQAEKVADVIQEKVNQQTNEIVKRPDQEPSVAEKVSTIKTQEAKNETPGTAVQPDNTNQLSKPITEPTEGAQNDSQSGTRISSEERVGEEPIEEGTQQGGGSTSTGTGGVVQEASEEEVESPKQKVFVYGTLKDDGTRFKAIGEHVEAEDHSVEGMKKQQGDFTTISPGKGTVKGKMIEVTPEQLEKLDKYEEKYDRKEIQPGVFAYVRKPEITAKGTPRTDKSEGWAKATKKYHDIDPSTPRVGVLKFFATGGKINLKEAIDRTGHKAKDLFGWTSTNGVSYDRLIERLKEETGNNEFDEADLRNEIDAIISRGKSEVFNELKQFIDNPKEQQFDISHVAEIATNLPEETQEDVVHVGEKFIDDELSDSEKSQLDKVLDKFTEDGNVDWKAITENLDGFEPTILELTDKAYEKLKERAGKGKQESPKGSAGQANRTPKEKAPTKVESARSKLKDQLSKVKDARKKFEALGFAYLPENKAKELLAYHKELVQLAKDAINLGIATIEEFAELIGQKVDAAIENAWKEANEPQSLEGKAEETPKAKSDEEKGKKERLLTSSEKTETKEPAVQDQDTSPPAGVTQVPPSKEGPTRKKALLNRGFEGTTTDDIKASIERHGLEYEIESHAEAEQAAEAFINDVGIDNALDAVRKNQIEDGAAAFVWAKIIDKVGDRIAEATSEEEIQELNDLEAELISEFDRKARSGGRFISALQEVYQNSDFGYKVDVQIEKYKATNNGEIPPDVEKRFRELEQKLQDVNKRLADTEQKLKDVTIEAIRAADQRERIKLITPEKRKKIVNFFDSLKVDTKNQGQVFASVIPGITVLPHVWNGSVEVIKQAVLAGADVANAIQAGIDYIKKNQKESFEEKLYRDKLSPLIETMIPRVSVKNDVKLPSVNKEGKLSIPKKLIHDLVESGIDNIEDLTTAVKDLIKDVLPDITHREVRDAITSYGKTVNLSQDEIDAQIRKMKRTGKVISGLEDVQKKLRPLRSGLQRDKLSDEERRMQKELRDAMRELPMDEAEEERTWKTALDAVKSRLRNSIADLENQIETGKRTPKKKGIEYDQEALALQARRDDLKKIIEDLEGKQGLTDEQKVRMAVQATEKNIADLERRINEKDFSKKTGKITPETPELKALRSQHNALRDTFDKLKATEGVADKERLEAQKKAVQKSIEEYRRKINEKDFSKRQKKELAPDDQLTQLKAEKLAVKAAFDKIQYENELKNRSIGRKLLDGVIEAWGLTRALRATGEFSFILLQGGVQTLAHPKNAAQAFITALRHFASESRSQEWFNKIKTQEWYARAKASKLALTEPNAKLNAREETFLGGWVNKIWDVIGLPIRAFGKKAYERWKQANPAKAVERAGIGYLDTLRSLRYLQGEDMLKSDGKTFRNNPQDFKHMADVINTFTGRASLGPAERISGLLSAVFFSPRNWASVIKQATPYAFYHFGKMGSKGQPWYKPSVAQKMAMGDYMKYVGLTGTIVALVAAMQNEDDPDKWSVELNPLSSDFLKLKKGNTRVDPWGGRVQMIVLQARLLMDAIKTATGEKIPLGTAYKSDTRLGLIMKMVQNKLAPSTAILVKYLNSRMKDGNRVDQFGTKISPEDELVDNLYPIYWETIRELHADQPETLALFLDFLAFIGLGTQTYKSKPTPEKDPLKEIQNIGRKIKSDMKLPTKKELMTP